MVALPEGHVLLSAGTLKSLLQEYDRVPSVREPASPDGQEFWRWLRVRLESDAPTTQIPGLALCRNAALGAPTRCRHRIQNAKTQASATESSPENVASAPPLGAHHHALAATAGHRRLWARCS